MKLPFYFTGVKDLYTLYFKREMSGLESGMEWEVIDKVASEYEFFTGFYQFRRNDVVITLPKDYYHDRKLRLFITVPETINIINIVYDFLGFFIDVSKYNYDYSIKHLSKPRKFIQGRNDVRYQVEIPGLKPKDLVNDKITTLSLSSYPDETLDKPEVRFSKKRKFKDLSIVDVHLIDTYVNGNRNKDIVVTLESDAIRFKLTKNYRSESHWSLTVVELTNRKKTEDPNSVIEDIKYSLGKFQVNGKYWIDISNPIGCYQDLITNYNPEVKDLYEEVVENEIKENRTLFSNVVKELVRSMDYFTFEDQCIL